MQHAPPTERSGPRAGSMFAPSRLDGEAKENIIHYMYNILDEEAKTKGISHYIAVVIIFCR